MLDLILAGTIAFGITFLSIPAIIRLAKEKELFDIPDGRKLHTRPIASLGGVGVFLGFLLANLLTLSLNFHGEFTFFLAAAVIMFFTGLKDDILILSASKKFLTQLGAAALVIHFGNIRIDSMHGFLGVYELPELVSLALSYITVIVVINSFNLIDGVDGLAGGLGILTTTVFGVYFLMANMPSYALFAFTMTASLIAFLIFNYNPAKIFMGDSGSLLLGLVNAILVIKFISVADYSAGSFPIESSVAIGFSILLVPLLDTLRVFGIRIYRGKSPFSPDRNHIHHLLLDRGLNHRHVTTACVAANVLFIGFAYYGRMLGSTILLSIIIPTCFALVGIIKYYRRARGTVVISSRFRTTAQVGESQTRVVPLQTDIAAADQ